MQNEKGNYLFHKQIKKKGKLLIFRKMKIFLCVYFFKLFEGVQHLITFLFVAFKNIKIQQIFSCSYQEL